MKTALASDFDGTLFFRDENPSIRTADVEAIRRFQQAGNLFGVCTGRALEGIRRAADTKITYDFYILVSGAHIVDRNLEPIRRTCITRELMEEVYDRFRKRCRVVIQADDIIYTFSNPWPTQVLIRDLSEVKGEYIYGLSMGTESSQAAEKVCREINERYANRLAAFQNIENVDIVSAGCSKGAGLALVKEHFGIACMGGIGDSYNDISMLEHADRPFTFPYAPREVQRKAECLVGSVGEALERMMEG